MVKQLLLRVPDDLHRRLSARAHREGRSINAIAGEMLGASVDVDRGEPRDTVRARAAALGILRTIESPAERPPSLAEVWTQLAAVELSAAELIDEGRGSR